METEGLSMEYEVKLKKVGRKKTLRQRIKENKNWQNLSTFIWPLVFGLIMIGLWQIAQLVPYRHFYTATA